MEECQCQTCSGRTREVEPVRATPEPEEPKSVHERLSDLSGELENGCYPNWVIDELNDICEKLDSIDDKVARLQKDIIKRTIDYTQFKLGEISKELY